MNPVHKGLTLTPWVLGLTLTPWVLGLIEPSAQRVNINPLGTWFNLTQCGKG